MKQACRKLSPKLLVSTFSLTALLLGGAVQSQAQEHFLTFGVGGGFTTQTGRTADYLDNGGNLQVTGGINLGPILGLLIIA